METDRRVAEQDTLISDDSELLKLDTIAAEAASSADDVAETALTALSPLLRWLVAVQAGQQSI